MEINNNFNLGEFIYLKTDPDQSVRMIVDIKISLGKSLIYGVNMGSTYSTHFEYELSSVQNKEILLGINHNNENIL